MSNEKGVPFDNDESWNLFWICTNAFNAYYYYKKFRFFDSMYSKMKYAPSIDALNSEEYENGDNHLLPYVTITGKIQEMSNPLLSSDNKTSGVIHVVQEYTESRLYVPLLLQYGYKGSVRSSSEVVPFKLCNEESSKVFQIEAPPPESVANLEKILPVVLFSVTPREESLINWIFEIIPGCELLIREVIKEKMLPIDATVTVMGRVLIGKDGIVTVSNPNSANTPFVITVLSPREILKRVGCDASEQIGMSAYFGTIAVGLIALHLIDLYRQSKGKPRLRFYNSNVNLYLSFITFTTWFPTFLSRHLFNGD